MLLSHRVQAPPCLGEPLVRLRLGGYQLVQLDIDRRQALGRLLRALAQPIAFATQIVELGMGGDRFVLAVGGAAHLVEVLGLVGLQLRVQRVEAGARLVECLRPRCHVAALADDLRIGLRMLARRLRSSLGQRRDPRRQIGEPACACAAIPPPGRRSTPTRG